jgi:hypothetical protein
MIAAAVSAVLLTGCSGGRPDAKPDASAPADHSGRAVYVGEIDASAASIWLQVDDAILNGAVCQDARPSMRFDPAATKEGKAALAYGGTVVGTVSFAKEEAVGTVELSGKKHRFRAKPADVLGDVCGRT